MPSLTDLNDSDVHIAPSDRVIRSVAVLSDTDPVDLPPLYDAVHVEALDELVSESGPDQCEITFEYAATRVHFSGDGDLTVTSLDD